MEKLVHDAEVPDEVLGFHAQQAVEKRIKSVLASHGVAFERTHNLAYLIGVLTDNGIDPPPDVEAVTGLTPWATEFRYDAVSDVSLNRDHARELVRAVGTWAEDAGPA